MSKLLPVDEFDLLIFGGTGDLALRKLLPALYRRSYDQQFVGDSRIISIGRGSLTRDQYLEQVEGTLRSNLNTGEFAESHWAEFRERIHYAQADATDVATWTELNHLLDGSEPRIRVAYLATSPNLFGAIAQGLKTAGLVTASSRIVLEKPLGHNLESARAINNDVGSCFEEHQIYRIDHYLGKETVQNLLALRFANSLFEPIWNRGAIDHIQITVAERSRRRESCRVFTTSIGALRDMVQNHLLQLRLPGRYGAPDQACITMPCATRRSRYLRALRPIEGDQILTHADVPCADSTSPVPSTTKRFRGTATELGWRDTARRKRSSH